MSQRPIRRTPDRALRGSLLIALLFSAAALLFTGCSHYRLGTESKLTFSTLYLAPVENEAGIPQATALFSTQLREAFLRDNRVTLVNSSEQADATLAVTLARYDRSVATYRPDDTGLARKFNVTVEAVCSLRDNRSGTKLLDGRIVRATRQVFTTPSPDTRESDQLQAEYSTLPLIASSLADRVTHAVLDVW
jgi:hypothetical protein